MHVRNAILLLCLAPAAPLWPTPINSCPGPECPLKTDYSGPPHNFTDRRGNPQNIQQEHVPSEDYRVGSEFWRVWLDPDPPVYHRTLPQEAQDVFGVRLPLANGWSYDYATQELGRHSLVVHWYEAVFETLSFGELGWRAKRIGANFGIRYAATGEDDPFPSDVHWLQFVFNNHHSTGDHGVMEAKIDEVDGGVYYDNGAPANGQYLRDRPRRPDVNQEHFWKAYLFLVQGPAIKGDFTVPPGKITVWGGVEWGWKNACIENCTTPIPEPAALVLLPTALVVLFLRKRKISRIPDE